MKEIWRAEKQILNIELLTNNADTTLFELRKNVESVFLILNSGMPNSFIYSMLAVFKCIELLNDYFIREEWEDGKKYAYWKGTSNKIMTLDYDQLKDTKKGDYNLATENKIRAILDEKTSLNDDLINEQIKQIVCSRNYSMHPQEKDSCRDYLIKEPKAEHIVIWFEMFFEIIQSMKES